MQSPEHLQRRPTVGKRVALIRCNDPYEVIPVGTQGVVTKVDDAGTIHVDWDNGSTLGLCPDAGDLWYEVTIWDDDLQVGDLVVSKSITRIDRTVRIVTKVEYIDEGPGFRPRKMIHIAPPDLDGLWAVPSSYYKKLEANET